MRGLVKVGSRAGLVLQSISYYSFLFCILCNNSANFSTQFWTVSTWFCWYILGEVGTRMCLSSGVL